MRRLTLLLSLAILSGGLFAQDLKMSLGVYAGLNLNSEMQKVSDGTNTFDNTETTTNGSIGVYFDAIYLLAQADFSLNLGRVKSKILGSGVFTIIDGTTETDYSIKAVNLTVLGKYPITLGSALIFSPALGVTYSKNLDKTNNTTGSLKTDLSSAAQAEMDDLILDAGLLLDFKITDYSFVRISGLFGWNATTEKQSSKDAAAGSQFTYTHNGFVPMFSLGMGIRI